ncbi:MAG: hypothetical protein MRY83_16450 [Flavobacteriales bacterium]|nr:hypothetical protein [Flavobacteriales bacterium]
MKYASLIIGILAMLFSCSNPSPEQETVKDKRSENVKIDQNDVSETDPIEKIRQLYKVVIGQKQDSILTIKTKYYNCPDYPEEGSVTYYHNNNDIRLIELNYSDGGHSGAQEQFFVENGKLFFHFFDMSYWTFVDSEGEQKTKDVFIQERTYFDNGKVIKCLSKEFSSNDGENVQDLSQKTPNKEIVDCGRDELLRKFKTLIQKESASNLGCIWE